MTGRSHVSEGKRRIDRIMSEEFTQGLTELDIDEVRRRRDECRDELDHLSMLRRYVQVRAEVLKGEMDRRRDGGIPREESLVDHLAEILTQEGQYERVSRGAAAIRLTPPDDEMLLARRRVEKLVAEQGVTDPVEMSDDELATASEELAVEERSVSDDRAAAIRQLTILQDELKRRFKDDPGAAIIS